MLKRIKDTIHKFSMLKKGDNVLVAISGGPDSVCLLLVLNSIKKKFGINLFCAHLNHRLRGVESDCDERYVKRLTKKHRIPLLIESRNVTKFAKDKKFSLEQAARKLRYDFLLQTARKIGADKIAVGHTKDDQVETLFMRLFRGTGLRGLRGIPGVRKISPNISIIRPLIETPREEILFFLKKRKIRARLDSTNAQTAFLRNRIRHELLPHIEKYYSPRIKEILTRTADSLDADYDYLIKQQHKAFKRIAKIKKDASISLPIKGLKSLPISFKRGVVRIAIENVKGNLEGIDYRHWVKIEDLMEGATTSLHLPGGINVVKRPKTVHFMVKKNGAGGEFKKIVPETNLIKIPGVTK
ncbi:MAG: tRNA lysidine(34) synthetase TilS, partial [Candidatus Omnitrophota bacterium]